MYLGINNFELPTFFLFVKTAETKGEVTTADWINGIKGHPTQLVTYNYEVNDSIYIDKFKGRRSGGLQAIGDKILIKYSIDNPGKNKVVGYYRSKSKPIKLNEDYE